MATLAMGGFVSNLVSVLISLTRLVLLLNKELSDDQKIGVKRGNLVCAAQLLPYSVCVWSEDSITRFGLTNSTLVATEN